MERLTPGRLAWAGVGLLLASASLGPWLGELAALRNWEIAWSVALAWLAWRYPERCASAVPERASRALSLAALVWLEAVSWSHWAALKVNGVDFSIFDWMLYSTHQGHLGYSPIYAVNHFGVHSSFLLLLMVPFHALAPGPGWLLTLGPLLLWAGLFPLRRLSRALVGPHGGLELALLFAWLGNAWLGRLATDAFRIESFTPVLTLWFLVGWVERRNWLTLATVLALWCAKEDTALALASFGAVAVLFERERRLAGGLLVLGSLTFIGAYTQLLQPAITQGAAPPYWRFWSDFGQSPREILRGIATSPWQVTVKLLTSGFWHVFAPLLFLPFASRRALSGLAPTLFLLGISNYSMMHGYRGYYPSPMVAWALFGTLEVVGRWGRSPRLTAVGLTAVAAFPLFADGYAKTVRVDLARRAALPAARAALQQTPASRRCVQPVLFPQIGYPEQITPLFEAACLDEPGAMGLVVLDVDPFPLTHQAMHRAVDGWRASGRARDLGAGLVFVGPPPSAPEPSIHGPEVMGH